MIKNENNQTLYVTNENFEPITVKANGTTYFEPSLVTKTGTELEFEKTYSDECASLKIEGDIFQEQYSIETKEDYVVQFTNSEHEYAVVTTPVDCTITRCGKNLIDIYNITPINISNIAYEDNSISFDYTGTYCGFRYIIQNTALSKYLCGKYIYSSFESFTNNNGSASNNIQLNGYVNGVYSSLSIHNIVEQVSENYTTSSIRLITNNSSVSRDGNFYINELMVGLGNDIQSFEAYQGETFELIANTPTKIPLINGTNTLYSNSENLISVRYLNEITDESEEFTPSVDFPQEIKCVNGILKSFKDTLENEIGIPNLYALSDGTTEYKDTLYIDKNSKSYSIERKINVLTLTEDTNFSIPVYGTSYDDSSVFTLSAISNNYSIGTSDYLQNNSSILNQNISGFYFFNNSLRVRIVGVITISELREYLSENPITILYPSVDTETISLDYENLKTYPYQTNTISNLNLNPDIEIKVLTWA